MNCGIRSEISMHDRSTRSPERVTHLRLPQNVACGFPALRSSKVASQHSDKLLFAIREMQGATYIEADRPTCRLDALIQELDLPGVDQLFDPGLGREPERLSSRVRP